MLQKKKIQKKTTGAKQCKFNSFNADFSFEILQVCLFLFFFVLHHFCGCSLLALVDHRDNQTAGHGCLLLDVFLSVQSGYQQRHKPHSQCRTSKHTTQRDEFLVNVARRTCERRAALQEGSCWSDGFWPKPCRNLRFLIETMPGACYVEVKCVCTVSICTCCFCQRGHLVAVSCY